jgi:SH3 domain protein
MKIALPTKHRAWLTVMMLLFAFSGAAAAFAETQYVSDLLIISLRQEQSDDSPIIGYLRSDTPVDVIEVNEDAAYVQTPDNLTGWVKHKFLVTEKPKAMQIEELKERIQHLEDKIAGLQQDPEAENQADMTAELNLKIEALQQEVKNEKHRVATLEKELRQANEQYSKLADQQKQGPDTNKELQDLKDKNQELLTELRLMQQKRAPSFFSGNIRWLLSGAGVLLLGFILGRSVRRKPRYGY